ncbi:MAG: AAA family ATPase [Janthinobacterium lividum]
MLKRLHVKNFTVFAEANFEFSPGLNVIVGTNGTGKSQVLKLGYAAEAAYAAVPRNMKGSTSPSELGHLDNSIAFGMTSRLAEVFLIGDLTNLVRHPTSTDEILPIEAEFETHFEKEGVGALKFAIGPFAPHPTGLTHLHPGIIGMQAEKPIFIPAKELLSLMPGIIGLSDKYADLFDSTYTELARALVVPLLKNLPAYAQDVLASIGNLLQGRIEADNGRFYLAPQQGGERFEVNLIAEGYRKLGTLAYLLANGSLSQENTLYWDEPEANLNPALLRELARLLVQLASQGFQIILATHSLFLLKEFHILAHEQHTTVRYFGLSAHPGEATQVTMRDSLELLPDIVALDAELDQSDRFQSVLDQEDAH